jgi:hypothetical protein
VEDAAFDVLAIVKGMVDAAGEREETDATYLKRSGEACRIRLSRRPLKMIPVAIDEVHNLWVNVFIESEELGVFHNRPLITRSHTVGRIHFWLH